MKLALISLAKEDPEGGGPIGLLPLFDSILVDRQVRAATRLGAEKVVFICPTMPGAILQYIDALKSEGVDAEVARRASDLVQYATKEDEVLIFADGILPSSAIEESIKEQSDETIYVVANADVFEDFERIDLNQRWVGLARLNASRLSLMIDVPDDWNVGSALLRIAIQSECKRERISDPEMTDGAVVHLEYGSETAEYTKRKLKEPANSRGNFLERFLLWPITRQILPRLWRAGIPKVYWAGARAVLLVSAAASAYFGIPLLVLGLLLLFLLIRYITEKIDIFSDEQKRSSLPAKLWTGLENLFFIGGVVKIVVDASSPDAMVPNLVLFAVLFFTLGTIRRLPEGAAYETYRPNFLLGVIFLLILAVFGQFLIGLYIVSIFSIIYLGAALRWTFRNR